MDMEFLNLLTNIRTPVLTWINLALSFLGTSTVFIAVLCMIFWCIDKNFAYRLGIIYVISGLFVQSLKIIFRVPRPWIKDTDFHIVEAARDSATGYSFPSGHTQNVTAMYSSFAIKSQKRSVKILCFGIIFLVMFSRMYLGVHTPLDVLASFTITLLVSIVINYYCENYSVDSHHASLLWGLLFILPAAAAGICIYVYYTVPDLVISNLDDVIKSAGAATGFLIGCLIEKKYIRFHERAATTVFQIIKYVLGISTVIGLDYSFKLFIKTILPDFPPIYFLSNMLLMIYIVAIYPMFIKKLFTNELYL